MAETIRVNETPEGLLLLGVKSPSSQPWHALGPDEKHILLKQSASSEPCESFAWFQVESLYNLLEGMHRAHWTGRVSIDSGNGVKRLFFKDGECVFAASSVIDDRLGEVLYRSDLISLDLLTDAAAQVTKSRKFGQVLLEKSILTHASLYEALQVQVYSILKSVFLVDKAFVEIHSKDVAPPTQVIFVGGFYEVVGRAYAEGCSYRTFVNRLTPETRIEVVMDLRKADESYPDGTFYGDFLKMLQSDATLTSLLERSKLIPLNTLSALFHLVVQGVCDLTQPPLEARKSFKNLAYIRGKLESYQLILNVVGRVYSEFQKPFPVQEIKAFSRKLAADRQHVLNLDGNGHFGKHSALAIMNECQESEQRTQFWGRTVESLCQFTLQVAGDVLPGKGAAAIKSQLKGLI